MPVHAIAPNLDDLTYNASQLALGEAVRAGTPISAPAAGWTLNTNGAGSVVDGTDSAAGEFVTIAATAAATTYRAGRAFNRVLGGGRSISFLLRRNSAATTVFDLWGGLGAAGIATASRWNKSLSSLTVGRWYRCSLSLGEQIDAGAPPNRIDLRDLTIMVTGDAGGPGSVSIGDFRVHQDRPRGKAVVFFDDGRKDTYTVAYPRLAAKGFPASVAIEHTAVGNANRVTLPELRELYAAGWDVSGHHTAQMTTLSETDQHNVHKASKAFLRDNGFIRGNRIWVWPGGARSDATEAIAAKYWATMRRVSSFATTGHAHVYDPVDPPLYYVTKTSVLATVLAAIDKADAAGTGIVLVFHTIVTPSVAAEDVTVEDYQAILDHLATKTNLDVVPASRVWTL
ncbi:esterase [Arthrobacter phage Lilmac1015]|uniref:Esterase n=1 Tax=Arthrobacter phage Lilmac1015 TaxID=2912653 RepID=A0AA49GYY3_9CAUD|nr:esterase [Arthrobacter phage Lilmac1015]